MRRAARLARGWGRCLTAATAAAAFAFAPAPAVWAADGAAAEDGGEGRAAAAAGEASFSTLAALALARDERISAARQAHFARLESAAEAKSVFYPQLSLVGDYNKRRGTVIPTMEYSEVGVMAEYRFLDVKSEYDYFAADAAATAEEHALRAMTQTVLRETAQARLDLHFAGEQQALLEKRLLTAREQSRFAERREAGGVGSYLDVALTRAESETIAADLDAAIAERESAEQTLTKLTGSVAPLLPGLRADFALPPLPPLAELLRDAREGAPLLLSGRQQTRAQRLRERSALADFAPVLSFVGEHSVRDNGDKSSAFAMRLRMPIYAGGGRFARARLATAQRREAEARLTESERLLGEEMRRLRISAASIARREKSLRSAIAAREILLEKTRVAWIEGARLAQDVLEAEQELFDARLRRRNLFYQYIGALTEMRQLSGRIDEDFLRQLDSYFGDSPGS